MLVDATPHCSHIVKTQWRIYFLYSYSSEKNSFVLNHIGKFLDFDHNAKIILKGLLLKSFQVQLRMTHQHLVGVLILHTYTTVICDQNQSTHILGNFVFGFTFKLARRWLWNYRASPNNFCPTISECTYFLSCSKVPQIQLIVSPSLPCIPLSPSSKM